MPAFRAVHILTAQEGDLSGNLWYFSLFTARYKWLTTLIVGVLYPFFLGWVLTGTLWYAETSADPTCFRDQQQSWYFVLWLVIFYIWIVAYNTAITISAIIYFRNRTLHQEYVNLIEQYGDQQPPGPNFSIHGLSPGTIQSFRVVEVDTPMQGQFVCSICQDDLVYHVRARVLACGHMFHLGCIDGWLMRKTWCPNCKRSMRATNPLEQPLLR